MVSTNMVSIDMVSTDNGLTGKEAKTLLKMVSSLLAEK
jgi:hypothetical protein